MSYFFRVFAMLCRTFILFVLMPSLLLGCSIYQEMSGGQIPQDPKMTDASIRRKPVGNPGGKVGMPRIEEPGFEQGVGGNSAQKSSQTYGFPSGQAEATPYMPASPYGAGSQPVTATGMMTGRSDPFGGSRGSQKKSSSSSFWPFHAVEARFEPYAAEGVMEVDLDELRNAFEPMPAEGVLYMDQSEYDALKKASLGASSYVGNVKKKNK